MNKKKFLIIVSTFLLVIVGLVLAVVFIPRDDDVDVNEFSEEYLKYKEIFDFELSDDKKYFIITDLKSEHSNDKEISIPNTIDNVPVKKWLDTNEKNFSGFKDVSIINIPENIEYIGTDSLDKGFLNGGTLGDSFLTASGSKTFSINVDPANKVYSSEDGILFNKDKTILIRYPNSKSDEETFFDYHIPEGVREIYGKAFYYNLTLRQVTFNNELEGIFDNAFQGCTKLKQLNFATESSLTYISNGAFKNTGLMNVNLPKGVTTISGTAFSYCTELTRLYIPETVKSFGRNILTGSPKAIVYTTEGNVNFLKSQDSFKNVQVKFE